MPDTKPFLKLTHEGALRVLDGALKKAEALGVPQNITIVDDGGNLLAFVRMDGAKTLSIRTSHKKAMSAASLRAPSGTGKPELKVKMAIATDGGLTNLEGGFPIVIDGICVGAIGVGSGTGAQDCEVARAGLAAVGAQAL
jgi:glc operon protein GlcG